MAHRCLRKHSDKQQCTLPVLPSLKASKRLRLGSFLKNHFLWFHSRMFRLCDYLLMMTLDMEGIEYCEGADYVQKVVTSLSGHFKRQACLIFKLKRLTTLETSGTVITACKRSLGQGNIFTPVCYSVHRGEYLGRYPRDQVHPPSSACWEIRATSGWYASYWNAFLLHQTFDTDLQDKR